MLVTDESGKEVPMTRQFEALANGLGKWTFTLQADADQREAQRVCPEVLHEGMALTMTVLGPRQFVLEARKVPVGGAPAKPEPPKDPLNELTDADLKTRCAENGIKYDAKKFNRFNAMAELREKLKPKTPEEAKL
jgi:hypothetical protein